MGEMKWITSKFLLTDSHEKVGSAWGEALDVVWTELLKLEEEVGKGISISFTGLYKQPGQLDFCTLEEFRLMIDELEHKYGEIRDASDGQSGEEPCMLTPKGRRMALSRRDELES